MAIENSLYDKKSIKTVSGKSADFNELAKDCVAFANSKGGYLDIGIEDDSDVPPEDQKVSDELVVKVEKRISETTINVGVRAKKEIANNSGEYIKLQIFPSQASIAATSDGKYYLRVGDSSCPLSPDELSRLLNDKPAFIWETKVTKYRIEESDEVGDGLFRKEIPAYDPVVVRELIVNTLVHRPYTIRGDIFINLTQREKICLGIIVQNESINTTDLAKKLALKDDESLRSWTTGLIKNKLIEISGRTKGTSYTVTPKIFKEIKFQTKTTLKAIEPYRLKELIYQDLKRYGESSISEIQKRIGPEISEKQIRTQLKKLIGVDQSVIKVGEKKWTKYKFVK